MFTFDSYFPDKIGHTHEIVSLAFTPCGKILASGDWSGTIRLWDLATGFVHASMEKFNELSSVTKLAFSSDQKTFACASLSSVYLWKVKTGRVQLELEFSSLISDIAFPQSGSLVAILLEKSNQVIIWNLKTDSLVRECEWENSISITQIKFSRDSKYLYCVCEDGRILIVDSFKMSVKHSLQADSEEVLTMAVSSNGDYIACGGKDAKIKLFETNSFEQLPIQNPHWDHINSIDFSSDNRFLLSTGEDFNLCLSSVETGELVSTIEEDFCGSIIACSPTGDYVAGVAGQSNKIKIWQKFDLDADYDWLVSTN
jgi:WD40 repeat protein